MLGSLLAAGLRLQIVEHAVVLRPCALAVLELPDCRVHLGNVLVDIELALAACATLHLILAMQACYAISAAPKSHIHSAEVTQSTMRANGLPL